MIIKLKIAQILHMPQFWREKTIYISEENVNNTQR